MTDRCRSCGAPIIWAKHIKTEKWMPLDEAKRLDGVRFILSELRGEQRAHVATKCAGHPSHFASCAQAAEWRATKHEQLDLAEQDDE
jgi:hypothetical protein